MTNKIKYNGVPQYTYDDVLIVPRYSSVTSRADVDLSVPSLQLDFPVLSANMLSVTGPTMHAALTKFGGIGVLPRFRDAKAIVAEFQQAHKLSGIPPWVSVGVGDEALRLAEELIENGARHIVIDIAHAANRSAVYTYNSLYKLSNDIKIVIGNFGSATSIDEFLHHVLYLPYAIKLGVGPGAACTTREKTGIGYPQVSLILNTVEMLKHQHLNIPLIADGGIKKAGDVAKAIAAGASAVMIGSLFAATEESSAPWWKDKLDGYKVYSGSASKESYALQQKEAPWRTAEGETFKVRCTGSVNNVLKDIEGGLRSAMSYVSAVSLQEFTRNSEFIVVTNNGKIENSAHGNKDGK